MRAPVPVDSGRRPAATRVIYVKERHAHLLTEIEAVSPTGKNGGVGSLDLALDTAGLVARLGAVRIEIQPPVRSIARRLRLTSGMPAVMITARLDAACPPDTTAGASCGDDATDAEPVALTVLALRPEMFRIVLGSAAPGG